METISNCPVCQNNSFTPFIYVKDYTVSNETFSIVSCKSCSFKLTNPRPEKSAIGPYYKSEEYISHSNTNKGFINKLYQLVRSYALKGKLSLVEHWAGKNASLLDIGCGTGAFLNTAKFSGHQVLGVEPDEDARAVALKEYALGIKEESFLTTLPNKSFDAITMWHVLEHVHDLSDRMGTLNRLVKDRGVVIIAVPNCNSKDAKKYGEYWAAYDVPRHLYHFTEKDIALLAKSNGFHLAFVQQMWFDSFYVSMLSEKYKNGTINYFSAIWNGIVSNLHALGKSKNASSKIYVLQKVAF